MNEDHNGSSDDGLDAGSLAIAIGLFLLMCMFANTCLT
jgi:hypothetical protein